MSNRKHGSSLWLIGWEGCGKPALFFGSLEEVIIEVNWRHALTGIQHAVREIGS